MILRWVEEGLGAGEGMVIRGETAMVRDIGWRRRRRLSHFVSGSLREETLLNR